MKKALVTGNLPEDLIRKLSRSLAVTVHEEDRPMESDALRAALGDKHGLLCMITDPVDASLLDGAPRLEMIANFGVGYNNIDVAAATDRGIMVSNTPGVLTDATADVTMALILAVGRRLVEADRHTRQGRFRFWAPYYFLGHEVSGKTLGIVGLGRIGAAVARRAIGFDMPVLYHNRNRLSSDAERKLGVAYADLDHLLGRADFVSLHVPLLPETHHLIDARALQCMKPSACLINTSRGPVVEEAALVQALQQGRLAGAGLDVYENEPALTPGLTELDNVVLLPHVGSATYETRHRMGAMAVDNLLDGLAGRRPPNCVNATQLGLETS